MDATMLGNGERRAAPEADGSERLAHSIRLSVRIALLLVVATLTAMAMPNQADAATIAGDDRIGQTVAVPAVQNVDVGKQRTVITLADGKPITVEYGDMLDPGKPAGLLGYGVLAGVALGLVRRTLHVLAMLLRIAR